MKKILTSLIILTLALNLNAQSTSNQKLVGTWVMEKVIWVKSNYSFDGRPVVEVTYTPGDLTITKYDVLGDIRDIYSYYYLEGNKIIKSSLERKGKSEVTIIRLTDYVLITRFNDKTGEIVESHYRRK